MRVYAAAVAAVDPRRVVARALGGEIAGAAEIAKQVAEARAIRLLVVGKAARGMAAEAERRFGDRLIDGLVIAPAADRTGGQDTGTVRSRVIAGAHPLPDASSEAAGRAALDFAVRAQSGELFVLALSGGASSLMAQGTGAVTLADKVAIASALMRAGASIKELNVVRRHLSAVKGGRLLRAIAPAVPVVSLILSDVLGNDLATIGSGPAAADPTTYSDAIAVLKRRGLWGRTPERVRDHLERGGAGEFDETVKPGDPALARVANVIAGDNRLALEAGAGAARVLGYRVEFCDNLKGEANDAGRALAALASSITDSRVCVLAGGETVVTVKGPGRGGRAQQCALAMASELAIAARERRIVALVAGTDGIDGPTDAAGAIVSPSSVARGAEAQVDATAALARNDSHTFFKALGDLVITGPTGTNVADLFVGLVNY
jgi:glycerate 2-kinase